MRGHLMVVYKMAGEKTDLSFIKGSCRHSGPVTGAGGTIRSDGLVCFSSYFHVDAAWQPRSGI